MRPPACTRRLRRLTVGCGRRTAACPTDRVEDDVEVALVLHEVVRCPAPRMAASTKAPAPDAPSAGGPSPTSAPTTGRRRPGQPQRRLHPCEHRVIADETASPRRGVEHRLGCPGGHDAVQRTEVHRFGGLRGDGDEQVLGLPAAVGGQHGGGVPVVPSAMRNRWVRGRLSQGLHDLGVADPPDVDATRAQDVGPRGAGSVHGTGHGSLSTTRRVRSRPGGPPGAATGPRRPARRRLRGVHPRVVRGHRQRAEEEVPRS